MKAVAWIIINEKEDNDSALIEKIIELGYTATHIFRDGVMQVYQVDMSDDDLTMLKITVPFIHVNKQDE